MTTSAQFLHPNVYEQCEGASNECDQLLLNVMPQTVHSSGVSHNRVLMNYMTEI